MNEEAKTYYRNLLMFKIDELNSSARKTVSDMKAGMGRLADPLDQASIESAQQMELSIRGRERETLNEMRQALLRIDSGIFGVCGICEKPISEGRLMARPTTLLCRNCQQREEKMTQAIRNRSLRGGRYLGYDACFE